MGGVVGISNGKCSIWTLKFDFGSFSLRNRVNCFKGGVGGVWILGY